MKDPFIAAVEQQYKQLVTGLFVPKGAFDDTPSSIYTSAHDKPLTADALLKTMQSLPRVPSVRFVESQYCTVTKTRWTRDPRTWTERFCSARVSTLRSSAILTGLILFAALFNPVIAIVILALTTLRPNRWRVATKPIKYYEQVPDPALYKMKELHGYGCVFVGHPATVAIAREQAREQGLIK